MRRAIIVLFLVSTPLLAQMRGGHFGGHFGGRGVFVNRPAPNFNHGVRFIGSVGFNNGPFFPGVPASATSLGPCGFTPCFFHSGFRHGFRRFGFPFFGGGFFGPSFVSAFPVGVPVTTFGDGFVDPAPAVQQASEPQRLEITVVDNREKSQQQSPPATQVIPQNVQKRDDVMQPVIPAIFIFKDGTRKELANYAIMRGQLIDVTDGKIFRIPLERLDREKTLAANAKAGREIVLP